MYLYVWVCVVGVGVHRREESDVPERTDQRPERIYVRTYIRLHMYVFKIPPAIRRTWTSIVSFGLLALGIINLLKNRGPIVNMHAC